MLFGGDLWRDPVQHSTRHCLALWPWPAPPGASPYPGHGPEGPFQAKPGSFSPCPSYAVGLLVSSHVPAHLDPDLLTVFPASSWTSLTTTDLPGLLAKPGYCPAWPALPTGTLWDWELVGWWAPDLMAAEQPLAYCSLTSFSQVGQLQVVSAWGLPSHSLKTSNHAHSTSPSATCSGAALPSWWSPQAAECSHCHLLCHLALQQNAFFPWLGNFLFKQCRQRSSASPSFLAKCSSARDGKRTRLLVLSVWCVLADHVCLCWSVGLDACVYIHVVLIMHVCMCGWPVLAQPCYWLVLEVQSCSSISLLGFQIGKS